MEGNLGSQASDLVAFFGVDVGEDRVCALSNHQHYNPRLHREVWLGGKTYRWDFTGQRNVLGQAHLALVERALEICLADGVATVCFLVDEGDQAVLDLKVHLEALLDLFLEGAGRLDTECLTTGVALASRSSHVVLLRCAMRDIRLRWVGVQVRLLDRQDVVLWVAAEVERVVAGHFVLFLDGDLVTAHP